MLLRRLEIKFFRNIQNIEIYPARGINVFLGKNGQGKTSVLEAIGYLASLRSFKGARSEEVINNGSQHGKVFGDLSFSDEFEKQTSPKVQLGVHFSLLTPKKAQKAAFINGKPIRHSSGYVSAQFGEMNLTFHAIIFNPNDHDLVRGEPSERRNYLDRVISAEKPAYLQHVKQYQRALEQRNALLKEYYSRDSQRYSASEFQRLLHLFTEPLIASGSLIVFEREKWIQKANPKLLKIINKITPDASHIIIQYESSVAEGKELSFSGQESLAPIQKIEENFRRKIQDKSSQEVFTRVTSVGPHRDDWSLVFKTQKLRNYGSQGEVRTALLALKLSEIELFIEARNQQPILLLDDFSSELDLERREFLLNFLKETKLQVFITTTEDIFGDFFRSRYEEGYLVDELQGLEGEKQNQLKPQNQKFQVNAGIVV